MTITYSWEAAEYDSEIDAALTRLFNRTNAEPWKGHPAQSIRIVEATTRPVWTRGHAGVGVEYRIAVAPLHTVVVADTTGEAFEVPIELPDGDFSILDRFTQDKLSRKMP